MESSALHLEEFEIAIDPPLRSDGCSLRAVMRTKLISFLVLCGALFACSDAGGPAPDALNPNDGFEEGSSGTAEDHETMRRKRRDAGTGGGADASTPPPPPPADGGTTTPTTGLFTNPMPWTKRVDSMTKSPSSDRIISWLSNAGGWGTGTFRSDFSIEVLKANASTPMRAFTPTDEFYSPDCDRVQFPVPPNGALEGESGYACASDGDCHLIVHDPGNKKLFEMWRANISGTAFRGGCAVLWDLAKAYPANLRGDGCTSADAGGFPITAMLANADEVFAGEVAHALRFILPNARIRRLAYVHPGTHTTNPTSGGADAPPYGVRFRLRADYPLASLPSEGARTIARALQRYGMFLADGGNVPLTMQSDRFTQHKWSEVGVNAGSLQVLKVSDFEVVDMGQVYTGSPDCTRNP